MPDPQIGDLIQDRISLLDAVLGGEPNVTLSTTPKGALQISVQSDAGAFKAISRLPCSIPGLEKPALLEKVALLSVLKRRAVTDITYGDDVLNVRAKSYSATLAVADGVPPEAIPPVEEPTFQASLDEKLWLILKACVALVAIEKSHPAMPDVEVHLRSNGKNLLVVAYDAFQACYVMTKTESAAELNLTLPLPRLQSLLQRFPGDLIIRGDDFSLEVKSKALHARLNFPLRNHGSMDPDTLVAGLEALEKSPDGVSLDIQVESLATLMDNIKAISQTDAVLQFSSTDDGKVTATYTGGSSSVVTRLKATAAGSIEFKVGAQVLRVLLAKAKKEPTLKVTVQDNRLLMLTETVCHLALLAV